jgi:hypothetical protein
MLIRHQRPPGPRNCEFRGVAAGAQEVCVKVARLVQDVLTTFIFEGVQMNQPKKPAVIDRSTLVPRPPESGSENTCFSVSLFGARFSDHCDPQNR